MELLQTVIAQNKKIAKNSGQNQDQFKISLLNSFFISCITSPPHFTFVFNLGLLSIWSHCITDPMDVFCSFLNIWPLHPIRSDLHEFYFENFHLVFFLKLLIFSKLYTDRFRSQEKSRKNQWRYLKKNSECVRKKFGSRKPNGMALHLSSQKWG